MRQKSLSELQKDICIFIYIYGQREKRSPAIRDIAKYIQYTRDYPERTVEDIETYEKYKNEYHSKDYTISNASYHISALEKRELITRELFKARTIQITKLGLTIVKQSIDITKIEKLPGVIPLLSRAAAGNLLEVFTETAETLDIFEGLEDDNIYAFRVVGNSMIEDHICDGDYILVKKQKSYKSGDTIVAVSNTRHFIEVTVKRYYPEKERIRLEPANADYEPIMINRKVWERLWKIQGKVIKIIRNT